MGLNARASGNLIFATILSEDASIRVKAKEGAPKAEKREWSIGNKSGIKWEYKYDYLTGRIKKVFVKENKFENGNVKVLNINVFDNGETISLQTPLTSNFAIDFLKRLPNVDFTKDVKIIPYNLTTEEGKQRKGVAIHQGEVKHANFFYDPDTKMNLHNFPEVDETDRYEDWYWKSYFGKVSSFLARFLEDRIIPLIEESNAEEAPQYEEMTEAEIHKEFEAEAPENLPEGIPEQAMSGNEGFEPQDDDLPF